MRKRNLTYYLKTIRLKALAQQHRLLANTSASKKAKAKLKAQNIKTFNSWDLSELEHSNDDHFFYCYGHFSSPSDLSPSLLFNEAGVAYSSLKNPFADFINPLYPAYYGLVCYNHFLQNKAEDSAAAFWIQVEFLSTYGSWKEAQFELPYQFDFPAFGLKAPWQAGITQALAASLFYRAHLLRPDKGYDKLGKGCLDKMLAPKERGGLQCTTPDGHAWIEEFPSPEPSLVLNGFIFCIITVLEYAQFTKDTLYKNQAAQLLESLMHCLHHYQYGKYLRHNMRHSSLSNLEYQGLYVFQFIHLYRLTGYSFFYDLAIQLDKAFDWKDFMYFYQIKNRKINLAQYLIQPV